MIEQFKEAAAINKIEVIIAEDLSFLDQLGLDIEKDYDIVGTIGFVKALSACTKNAQAVIDIDSKEKLKKIMSSETLYIICDESDFREDLNQAYLSAKQKKQCAYYIFMSQESKTADIEKVLVSGVQGPKKVLFVCVKSH